MGQIIITVFIIIIINTTEKHTVNTNAVSNLLQHNAAHVHVSQSSRPHTNGPIQNNFTVTSNLRNSTFVTSEIKATHKHKVKIFDCLKSLRLPQQIRPLRQNATRNYLVTEKCPTVSTSSIWYFYAMYINISSENTDKNNWKIFIKPLLTRMGKIYYCNISRQARHVIHNGTSRCKTAECRKDTSQNVHAHRNGCDGCRAGTTTQNTQH